MSSLPTKPPIVPSEGIEAEYLTLEGNREVRHPVESADGKALKPQSTSFPSGRAPVGGTDRGFSFRSGLAWKPTAIPRIRITELAGC
jgi:hypothetical protein